MAEPSPIAVKGREDEYARPVQTERNTSPRALAAALGGVTGQGRDEFLSAIETEGALMDETEPE